MQSVFFAGKTDGGVVQVTDEASLAKLIAGISSRVQTDPQVSGLTKPLVSTVSDPYFDWKQVLFGTDSLTDARQSLAQGLISDIQTLVSFQATDPTSAQKLIDTVVTEM